MRQLAAVLAILTAAPLAAQEQPVRAGAPKAVSLTVYNQNFALVRETRDVALLEGENWVRVEDVAAQIDPTSVHLKSLTAPNALLIKEQNYQYDLISPAAILRKAIGEEVTVRYYLDNGEVQTRRGTLLNGEEGQLVIRGAEEVTLQPWGEISLDALPEGLISRPQLLWKLACTQGGNHETELSYMANGLNWVADYVAVINRKDTKLDLTGWVTLNNQSGATYGDAALQLIAGDVRRVTPPAVRLRAAAAIQLGVPAAAPAFEEKPFFEYHLYTMTEPTTIRDKETKQLGLLSAADVPVQKILVYDPGWGTQPSSKLNVMVEFENSEDNHMGMPLPKGKVRCYKADDQGRLQFLGEDLIDHTPRDEEIRLWIGDAFDVVGEQKLVDERIVRDTPRVTDYSYEVNIRNHKKETAKVEVVERFWGDWEMMDESQEHTDKDAHTVQWELNVPPDGDVTITFRVRIR